MPTLRKFLKRFLPRVFDSYGSQPSKQTPHNISSSKHSRARAGYSQFGAADYEMGGLQGQSTKGPGARSSTIKINARSNASEADEVDGDHASEEGILTTGNTKV